VYRAHSIFPRPPTRFQRYRRGMHPRPWRKTTHRAPELLGAGARRDSTAPGLREGEQAETRNHFAGTRQGLVSEVTRWNKTLTTQRASTARMGGSLSAVLSGLGGGSLMPSGRAVRRRRTCTSSS
jgi:hypothetical protein